MHVGVGNEKWVGIYIYFVESIPQHGHWRLHCNLEEQYTSQAYIDELLR